MLKWVSMELAGPQQCSPGFKVVKTIINMPKKRKTKIPKFPLYFEDFSFINLLIFNVFVVGLNELKIKKNIFSLLSYDEKQLFTKRDKKTQKNDFFTPLYCSHVRFFRCDSISSFRSVSPSLTN